MDFYSYDYIIIYKNDKVRSHKEKVGVIDCSKIQQTYQKS